jgi:tetratricopeptide (TPR) repeat protein
MGAALLLVVTLLGSAATVQEPGDGPDLAAREAEAERLYAEDDLDGAIAIYEELARRHTGLRERTRMLLAAAWLQHFDERWEAAQESMLAALALDPDYPFEAAYYSQEFVDLYRRSLARARSERARQARERTATAVEAIAEGRLDAARALLEEALALDPGNATALYNLALVELKAGRRQQAMDGFQRLLARARGAADDGASAGLDRELHAQTLANLGLLHLQQDFLEDAEAAFRESLSLTPDSAGAWTGLGLTHRRIGRHDEALEDFRRAYELAPTDAAVVNNLALSHLDAENWERAAELLEGAIETQPGDTTLWLNLGMAQRGLERLDEASASFRRAIDLDPENVGGAAATAATHLALTRLQARDPRGSIEAANRSLTWDPERVESLIYLGLAQQALGDLASAQDTLRRAFELDPTRADTANNVGNAYFAAGDYEAAARAFRQALELRPDFETARENLALTEQRLRRADSAEPAPDTGASRSADRRSAAAASGSAPERTPAARERRRSRDAAPSSELALGLTLVDDRHDASGLRAARVVTVAPGSLGERAGVQPDDLVVRADSAPIESAAALERLLGSLGEGRDVRLDLVRDGELLRLAFPGPSSP